MKEIDPRVQAEALSRDLDAIVSRYIDEWDMRYYEIVGILQFAASKLQHEAFHRGDDDDKQSRDFEPQD